MNLDKEKLTIIKWVISLKDEACIERLKTLKRSYKKKKQSGKMTDVKKDAIDEGLGSTKSRHVKPRHTTKSSMKRLEDVAV